MNTSNKPETAVRESPIYVKLEDVVSVVEELNGTIKDLSIKLSAIRVPEKDSEPSAEKIPPDDNSSPLLKELEGIRKTSLKNLDLLYKLGREIQL